MNRGIPADWQYESFPALHAPGDPVSPILGKLLRKPFAAQEIAIAGAVARLRRKRDKQF
jgi:hypothetical protein